MDREDDQLAVLSFVLSFSGLSLASFWFCLLARFDAGWRSASGRGKLGHS